MNGAIIISYEIYLTLYRRSCIVCCYWLLIGSDRIIKKKKKSIKTSNTSYNGKLMTAFVIIKNIRKSWRRISCFFFCYCGKKDFCLQWSSSQKCFQCTWGSNGTNGHAMWLIQTISIHSQVNSYAYTHKILDLLVKNLMSVNKTENHLQPKIFYAVHPQKHQWTLDQQHTVHRFFIHYFLLSENLSISHSLLKNPSHPNLSSLNFGCGCC